MREHLSKIQTNQLYRALERAGLDPRGFRWTERSAAYAGYADAMCPCLEHKLNQSAWLKLAYMPRDALVKGAGRLRRHGGEHWIEFSPGVQFASEVKDQLTWEEVVLATIDWAERVHRILAEPDLWAFTAEHEAAITGLASASDEDDTFSPTEREMLTARLDEVVAQLHATHDLTSAQLTSVHAEVAELKNDLVTLNRRQWVRSAFGWVITLAIRFALPATVTSQLLNAVADGLRALTPG